MTHCRRNTDDLPVTETQLVVALRVTPIATLWRQATVAVTRERRYTGYHYALTLTAQHHESTTTSLRSLPTSTGCAYLSASSTSCAYWFTSAFRGPSAPSYLQNAICPVASAESRRHRLIGRSHRAGDATYNNGRRTAPSPSQHRAPRTVCRTRSVAAHLWLSSNVHSKLTFIFSVFINIVFNYF